MHIFLKRSELSKQFLNSILLRRPPSSEQAHRGRHASINEQASAIDITCGGTAQIGNGVRYLLALGRALDGHNGRDHALDLGVLLELDVQQRRPHPCRAHGVDADPLRAVVHG